VAAVSVYGLKRGLQWPEPRGDTSLLRPAYRTGWGPGKRQGRLLE
jgi:hypothetical protein